MTRDTPTDHDTGAGHEANTDCDTDTDTNTTTERSEPRRDYTRRQVIAGAGLGLTTSLVPWIPTTITGDDRLTPLAQAFVNQQSPLRGPFSTFDADPKRFSGNPSWTLALDDEDDHDLIEDWAGDHADHLIIRQDREHNRATVAAPVGALQSLLNEGYIEWADLNVRVSLVEPPRLPIRESQFEGFTRAQRLFVAESESLTEGVAFEVEVPSDLQDVRETVRDDPNTTGDGRALAVIDTGCAYDPDLFGRTVTVDGEETTEPRILDGSTDYTSAGDPTVGDEGIEAVHDGNDHGTHVAATAASSDAEPNRGVAPDADLLILRALDDDGAGATADIAAAIRHAVTEDVDAMCLSLGSPLHSMDLADAIETATEADIPVVVASGNDRYASRFAAYPASDPNTLAVSATTTADAPDTVESAAFANVGPSPGTTDFSEGATAGTEVDVGAPGMEIHVDGVGTMSGTSMATPVVAGAATLLGSVEDSAERIRETAAPAEQLAAAEAYSGLLDIQAALDDDPPEETQRDSMTDLAATRDQAYRSESAARGGRIAAYLF